MVNFVPDSSFLGVVGGYYSDLGDLNKVSFQKLK